jgi:type III pantothenate kinase
MNEQRIPTILACNCGNTRIQIAAVAGEEVSGLASFALGQLEGLGQAVAELFARLDEPKRIAAASVNPAALKALEAAVLQHGGQDVLVVGRDLPLPIDTDLPAPDAIGTDRLCAASAAFDRLGQACVVADFGTAITIDAVNDEGVFLGGAILPGLAMGARALAGETAQLPEVRLAEPAGAFGKNTDQAILHGLVGSARGALRYFAEAYATEMGAWPSVIVTGGDASLVCPHPGQDGLVQAVVDDLALRGVAMACYRRLLDSK